MQFVPLWTSILRSRKVAALPDDLYRTWTLCLLTAQEHDHKHGSLPAVDDFSYALHMEAKSLMSRLSRLVTLRFLDVRDGIYYIHDWDDWKHRPDPTGAARKRSQREREREKDEATYRDTERNGEHIESENVTVTSVTSQDVTNVTVSRPNSPTPTPQQHTPLPPGHGGDECVSEPFEPDENPEIPPILVIPWTSEEKRTIDLAIQRWGSSNGDACVGDLLRRYPAIFVAEMCDKHYATVQKAFDFRRLEGLCRVVWNGGKWKPSSSGPRLHDPGPTNQPISAQNLPDDLGQYTEKANRSRALAKAQGMDV